MKYILMLAAAVIAQAGQAWCGEVPVLTELKAAGSGQETVSVAMPGIPDRTTSVAAVIAPDLLVKKMTEEVLKMVKTAGKEEILALVLPNFNFERMTMMAAGKNWAQATAEQQAALVKEFRQLLVRTYSMAIDGAVAGNTVEVKPLVPQPNPDEALVKTLIKMPGQPAFTVDYRLENAGASWKVFDVVIEGISLVTNYRNQFSGVIAGSGIDGLIKALAAKNSKP